MSREIKFRGMDANGVMRYGRLSQDKPDTTVYFSEYSQRICWDNSNIPVSNKSLGEYTGLKDKNGKEIFEGDIVEWSVYEDTQDTVDGQEAETRIRDSIAFSGGCFKCDKRTELLFNKMAPHRKLEIIGNIYENPNLLK